MAWGMAAWASPYERTLPLSRAALGRKSHAVVRHIATGGVRLSHSAAIDSSAMRREDMPQGEGKCPGPFIWLRHCFADVSRRL